MKFLITLSLTLLLSSVLWSQKNLVIFTQESKPFYLVVNGIRQNESPETNVKVEDLPGDFYRVKVVFSDGETPDVDQSVSFFETNEEISLEVKKKRKKYKLKFAGRRPIEESTHTNIATTEYRSTDQPTQEEEHQSTGTDEGEAVQEHSHTHTSSETQIDTNHQSDDVNINMNERGVSIDINIKDQQREATETISTENVTSNSEKVHYSYMANGTMCGSSSVSQKAFMDFKYDIESTNMFNREEKILEYFSENCMLSDQVAGVISIDYSTVDAKKIAKEGYRYTYDTENYDVVIDALKSENDREEVIGFIGAGSHSGSAGSGQQGGNSQGEDQSSEEAAPESEPSVNYSKIPSYAGYINCNQQLLSDFSSVQEAVEAESFSSDKRKVIEMATKNKCLSVDHIEKLLGNFTHESDKMELLKWAYSKTYDIDNFYTLSSELTHSSSKEELDEFIDEQPTENYTYVFSTTGNDGTLIDADDLKRRMEEESFSDNQLDLAKQAFVSRYVSVEQLKSLSKIFSHESDVIKLYEMAYKRTVDPENFYKLRSTLKFSSSKEELDAIME
ncbi:MAG: DUF4476 domain-containing protein [Bacteroidota bacterium]